MTSANQNLLYRRLYYNVITGIYGYDTVNGRNGPAGLGVQQDPPVLDNRYYPAYYDMTWHLDVYFDENAVVNVHQRARDILNVQRAPSVVNVQQARPVLHTWRYPIYYDVQSGEFVCFNLPTAVRKDKPSFMEEVVSNMEAQRKFVFKVVSMFEPAIVPLVIMAMVFLAVFAVKIHAASSPGLKLSPDHVVISSSEYMVIKRDERAVLEYYVPFMKSFDAMAQDTMDITNQTVFQFMPVVLKMARITKTVAGKDLFTFWKEAMNAEKMHEDMCRDSMYAK